MWETWSVLHVLAQASLPSPINFLWVLGSIGSQFPMTLAFYRNGYEQIRMHDSAKIRCAL